MVSEENAMDKCEDGLGVAPLAAEGGRRPTGAAKGGAPVKRWSSKRKAEVVMRLLRGEPLDAVSREVGVEVYRLSKWRDRGLAGMEKALTDGPRDERDDQLDEARRKIGDLLMEVELLKKSLPPSPKRRKWKR